MRFELARHLRTPLLFCTLSWLFSAGLVLWSWQQTAQAASQLDRLRRESATSERQLSELRRALQSAEHARQLLADIQALEALGMIDTTHPAIPHTTADTRWREYPVTLESTFVHEEALFSRIADWQARSPIQHQLRGCRLARAEDGLFASCKLVALELQR